MRDFKVYTLHFPKSPAQSDNKLCTQNFKGDITYYPVLEMKERSVARFSHPLCVAKFTSDTGDGGIYRENWRKSTLKAQCRKKRSEEKRRREG